jgi:DNA-binding response OmpR family regulator
MNLSAVRTLVVEDNRQIVELVRTILAALEARDIDVAESPSEAWPMLETRAYHLLIVDRTFEGDDGLDLVRRVRKPFTSPAAFLPILMLTASSERSVVAAARDAGVSEYLVKPFTAAALVDRVHAMLSRPRPFIQTCGYFGPDRRRRAAPEYRGPERRTA